MSNQTSGPRSTRVNYVGMKVGVSLKFPHLSAVNQTSVGDESDVGRQLSSRHDGGNLWLPFEAPLYTYGFKAVSNWLSQ